MFDTLVGVFDTLVGMFVLSVMWSEVLMTSAISCPLWSSAYESQRVECAFALPARTQCGISMSTGCAVSRRYINVCNSDVFSVVNMYHDHLKFGVVCINGRRYVYCSECYVVPNECDKPTHALCNLSVRTVVKLCTLGVFALVVSLVSSDCDDICMYVVNKQFELLEFVFYSVYVDPQYEISLTFTAEYVCCHVVVVLGLSVRLSYPM